MQTIESLLETRFGGVIRCGSHKEDGECCILELAAAAQGLPWTDDPEKVRCWDIRAINDAYADGARRTKAMLRLYAAYAGSMDWPTDRQQAVASRIAILTMNRIIAELPGLSDEVRQQCRDADTLDAAAAAAWAAEAAEAARAAAWAAARAAEAAAEAAAAAAAWASDDVLDKAVDLWIEAAANNP